MDIFEIDGRMFEVDILAPAADEPVSLECWDTSETGGLLFIVQRDADGTLQVRPQNLPIPFELFSTLNQLVQVHL